MISGFYPYSWWVQAKAAPSKK